MAVQSVCSEKDKRPFLSMLGGQRLSVQIRAAARLALGVGPSYSEFLLIQITRLYFSPWPSFFLYREAALLHTLSIGPRPAWRSAALGGLRIVSALIQQVAKIKFDASADRCYTCILRQSFTLAAGRRYRLNREGLYIMALTLLLVSFVPLFVAIATGRI